MSENKLSDVLPSVEARSSQFHRVIEGVLQVLRREKMELEDHGRNHVEFRSDEDGVSLSVEMSGYCPPLPKDVR
jgi:hypothetical protein